MRKKTYKRMILFSVILTIGVGIAYVVHRVNTYTSMVLPSDNIKCGTDTYYLDPKLAELFKVPGNGMGKFKLIKEKLNEAGIIIYNKKIYYVIKKSKKICSMDLDGKNERIIDECNIIMPYQPMFKLGVHIYYYNKENILTRIDNYGRSDRMGTI